MTIEPKFMTIDPNIMTIDPNIMQHKFTIDPKIMQNKAANFRITGPTVIFDLQLALLYICQPLEVTNYLAAISSASILFNFTGQLFKE